MSTPSTDYTVTTIHLVRHGEVHNPEGLLYGRMDGFHLSDLGKEMAQRVTDALADRAVVSVTASPLERVQETAAPIAASHGLEVGTDHRIVESGNVFQGKRFGVGDGVLKKPQAWRYLWNPWRPSWGEPYKEIVARMMAAVYDARDTARGREAVLVSHQLPIWITRLHIERRSFVHDPRRRQCTLCSLTSLTFSGDKLTTVRYSEPAADLIPLKDRKSPFSAGGARDEDKPPPAGA
ncbi:histidine phosphatase family protein [soil metagenome]